MLAKFGYSPKKLMTCHSFNRAHLFTATVENKREWRLINIAVWTQARRPCRTDTHHDRSHGLYLLPLLSINASDHIALGSF